LQDLSINVCFNYSMMLFWHFLGMNWLIFPYLDLHLEIDSEERLRTNFTTNEMISIFPLWTSS
jgi:hypothetical protein